MLLLAMLDTGREVEAYFLGLAMASFVATSVTRSSHGELERAVPLGLSAHPAVSQRES